MIGFRNVRKTIGWTRFLIVALAPIWMAPGPRPAQAGPENLKVGFVDVTLASRRSQSIQKGIKAAERELKLAQEKVELQIKEYRRLGENLLARRSVLSEQEIRSQEEDLEQQREEVDQLSRDLERQLRRTETEVMEPAVDRILETVRAVAKKHDFDLILRSDVVLYAVDGMDVTALVVEELDRPPKAGGDAAQP